MIPKFNLYDFIAVLIPGVVFLWCLNLMMTQFGSPLPFDFTGGLAETSILVALGFITGLMLQAFGEQFVQPRILLPAWGGFPSARWMLPEDTYFSAAYRAQVKALIAERFKVSSDPDLPANATPAEIRELRLKKNQELFFLCFQYVDNLSPRPLMFGAQFGMFRSLLVIFSLLCGCALLGIVLALLCYPSCNPGRTGWFAVLAALFGFCAWLSCDRCRVRSENFARSVYDLFVAGVAAKPGDAD